MARHAKVLDDRQLAKLEDYIRANSPSPERDIVILNLSFRAGLRVGEIAKLRWTDVCDAEGNVDDTLFVPSQIVKFQNRERTIPIHPRLKEVLIRFRAIHREATYIVTKLYRDGTNGPISDNALTVYLHRLYKAAGLENASSHSGRRTFTTKLARRANAHHCSIRDVQLLVGHSHIQTTERYIQPSDDVSKMIMEEL